jgi:hypothetical protein
MATKQNDYHKSGFRCERFREIVTDNGPVFLDVETGEITTHKPLPIERQTDARQRQQENKDSETGQVYSR